MSTYTGTTGTKRGMGETIWLGIITFVAASALVLALFAMQRGGSTGPAPVVDHRVNSVIVNPGNGVTPIVSNPILTRGRFQGHPLP